MGIAISTKTRAYSHGAAYFRPIPNLSARYQVSLTALAGTHGWTVNKASGRSLGLLLKPLKQVSKGELPPNEFLDHGS